MTGSADRLLAAVLGRASEELERERELGPTVWRSGASRCYLAQRDGAGVLTLTGPGGGVRYEVVGVDLAVLT